MKTIRNIIYAAFALLLASFGLLPQMQAVVPAPDGGYPGFNTAEGLNALFNLTTGVNNTATGFQALFSNFGGSGNTATGESALYHTTASNNTANGDAALFLNSTGAQNTATGSNALKNNTTASNNTADGFEALFSNISGEENTAIGAAALSLNTLASNNTAVGFSALASNNTGSGNTATGSSALFFTTASNNTANGDAALFLNSTGAQNTATGSNALKTNSTASNNTAIGYQALLNSTGSNNIALGSSAGSSLTAGSNNIHIGAFGQAGDTDTIRIGKGGLQTRAFMQGIRGRTTGNANAIPVLIDSAGQLGTQSSSRRFKGDIKPMDATSESLLALKPVMFHYKSDKTKRPEFGLIAEDVADVNPDLVVRDENGEIYTVRYDAVNAMLLNEFLKEHKKVQQLQVTVAQQQKDFQAAIAKLREAVTAQLNAQAAQIQKVSAQMELSRPAPQTVKNND